MTASKKSGTPASHLSPPIAKTIACKTTHHGVARSDKYAWLRDDNWQQVMRDPKLLDKDIRAHLQAENAYTKAQLKDTEELQKTLFQEMKGRIKEDDSSVPSPDGPFAYFHSYMTGGQYPLICRAPRNGGKKHVLIDGNLESKDEAYWSLGGISHSSDHKTLAYGIDDKGSGIYRLKFRDIASGRDLDDALENTSGSAVWAADSKTLFYVRKDDQHRPLYVYRHILGTDPAEDELIYEEKDSGFYVGVGSTQNNKFIVISTGDHQTSECYVIDADKPLEAPRLIAPRDVGHEYSLDHHAGDAPDGRDDRFIILTNSDNAVDFRICSVIVTAPQRDNWTEILPHKPGRLVLYMTAFKNYLVRLEREDGLPRIVVRSFLDDSEYDIAFDEDAYSLGMSGGYEYDTTTLRFSYSSMTTPSQTFDFDMASRKRVLRKTQEVPSGHDPHDYITARVFAPARDGESIPISLLYHKDTKLDGSAPLLLYGYGSYGISIPAGFSTSRLSLVDRGFVFAIAHIRGGKDKGYGWYTGGKMKTKLNTFTDFLDAGAFLTEEGVASPKKVIANGGSAGGMLVAAAANMAPEQFLGIIANVPFVDVLNTMLDDTLPLTPPEWLEWGNPILNRQEFDLIASYCPYTNVEAQAYPHILAQGGLTDSAVTYWEPAKWVAKLRAMKTDDNLLLLKINMGAGHGGASGRFDSLKELALDYAFALKIAGKTEAQTP